MIPSIAVIRIQGDAGWWCPPIPVPLFLLWIFAILLSPLLLIGLVVLWAACIGAGIDMWGVLAAVSRVLCALPGTDVRVMAEGKHVWVKIV